MRLCRLGFGGSSSRAAQGLSRRAPPVDLHTRSHTHAASSPQRFTLLAVTASVQLSHKRSCHKRRCDETEPVACRMPRVRCMPHATCPLREPAVTTGAARAHPHDADALRSPAARSAPSCRAAARAAGSPPRAICTRRACSCAARSHAVSHAGRLPPTHARRTSTLWSGLRDCAGPGRTASRGAGHSTAAHPQRPDSTERRLC